MTMFKISADIRLRPTRIGFLASPNDLVAVRGIMRACTCVWGGIYNPIIPVFSRVPSDWRTETKSRVRGREVAKTYTRLFEPDVFVETKLGLLDEAGLGALRTESSYNSPIRTLDTFLRLESSHVFSKPAFGLNIHEVLTHVYNTEQKYFNRDERDSLYVSPARGSGVSEAIFGVYPDPNSLKYIERAYDKTYRYETVKPTPFTWWRVFLKGAQTPLNVTCYDLDVKRSRDDSLLVFVFDPKRATDLIDLWNLRLESFPVLPVPLEWFEELGDEITKIIRGEQRPVLCNAQGLMDNVILEFSRSIYEEKGEELVRILDLGLFEGDLRAKVRRNETWTENLDDRIHKDGRLKISAKAHHTWLTIEDDSRPAVRFSRLDPDFAVQNRDISYQWVNVLDVKEYGNDRLGTVFPSNVFDRTWPAFKLGGEFDSVGSEGWVFAERYHDGEQFVFMLTKEEAIAGWLEKRGIRGSLSEPGRIAQQMLEQLEGLSGANILADIRTLELLNKMAGGLRRRSNDKDTIEESFELRSASLEEWIVLVKQRNDRKGNWRYGVDQFVKHSVIQIGLETHCPHCHANNWYTLTNVDYSLTCTRCLKHYDFPQVELRQRNRNFTYRVLGPFSVPDYARGAYSALLSLRLLKEFSGREDEMTFSTAMDISVDGKRCEVDFIAWHAGKRSLLGDCYSPILVLGEAKSRGRGELIKDHDVAKLKSLVAKLPGAFVVFSVLRDHFTTAERILLQRFVKWGRRPSDHGLPRNPVLLLTEHELTMRRSLAVTWKELGSNYERFVSEEYTGSLMGVADATQQIYLGLNSFRQAL